MYLEHFKLKEFPFSLTPNTYYFCNLPTHQEALNVLLVCLRNGEGFIKIIGEVGTGKTLLCRKLLSSLGDEFVTAYIPNPDLSVSGLHKAITQELGVKFPENVDHHQLLNLLNEKLLALHREGKHVTLVVDEAQVLTDHCLEALRLLSNLETESDKLIQIVLLGQPELDEKLNNAGMRQLKQRIVFSYYLEPIKKKELNSYLSHRLAIAGYTKGSLFSRRACALLFKASRGIPRLINILCHKALMVAYGQGENSVNGKAMRMAIQDTDVAESTFRGGLYLLVNSVLVVLLVVLGVELFFAFGLHL